MSTIAQQTLKQKFDAFVSTPKGKHYAANATNFTYNKIVIRCIDPRLNPILQALDLQGDHVVSIANAGPVLPAYREAKGRDIQASFELFAGAPSVKEVYIVPHAPTCKYCGAIIHGIIEAAENHHLCRYISDTRALLSPIEQKRGTLVSGFLPFWLGLLNRDNVYTYPVMKRRADVLVYIVLIEFGPLRVKLYEPGSDMYVTEKQFY